MNLDVKEDPFHITSSCLQQVKIEAFVNCVQHVVHNLPNVLWVLVFLIYNKQTLRELLVNCVI
jgi:hypothetical protein